MRATVLHYHLTIDVAGLIGDQEACEIGELAMLSGATERIAMRPAFVAPFGAGAAVCAGARLEAPHSNALTTRDDSISRTDNWFPHHCDWKMAPKTPDNAPCRAMDSREMPFWEGSYGISGGGVHGRVGHGVFSPCCGPRAALPIAHRSIAAGPRRRNCANASHRPAPPSRH